MLEEFFSGIDGFEWDKGNIDKSRSKHGVEPLESQEVFYNRPIMILEDPEHSTSERRICALGVTNAGRRLFVAFTLRGSLIRVISARDMSRAQRRVYGQD